MEQMRSEIEWPAQWISDPTYSFESPESPVPFVFRRRFIRVQPVASAKLSVTAFGIFDGLLNGQRIGEEYFAPGFTSYEHILQYMEYDVTSMLREENDLQITVAGGWAVGRSTFVDDTTQSFSKISADAPMLLAQLFLTYEDGTTATIGTDETWTVTQEGPVRFADWYDGEIYDARIDAVGDEKDNAWKTAQEVTPRLSPEIVKRYGEPVVAHERLVPTFCFFDEKNSEWIYDFGQNFAGVVELSLRGQAGQTVRVRHGEVLMKYPKTDSQTTDEEAEALAATDGMYVCDNAGPGELYIKNLRGAKQELTYICKDGEQTWSPRLTYMGFRYIGISGIDREDILSVTGIALYSDVKQIGAFSCSDERLNCLQKNIEWSSKSNFVDIPTDCPQRDERQGWTGDIALFGSTACFNFDLTRFLGKWLLDQKFEQGENGEIPFVIPQRTGHTPAMVTSGWSDSCIMVPWALYLSNGDIGLLHRQYPVMQKHMNAAEQMASWSAQEYGTPYIWKLPFHFGDWCAPYGNVQDWLARGPWVGTAYWCYMCKLMTRICSVLDETEEAAHYADLAEKISDAWYQVFTDEEGKLKEEFQTGYVLPLAFEMGTKEQRAVLADRLAALIKANNGCLNTGFQATPYILFALCDNGKQKEAYDLLLQEDGPSWLYQVKHGATTFWEQWQTIEPEGGIREASMNHYAYGSVGDFFYRRICGLEAEEGGYKTFRVAPIPGAGLTWAECSHETPYGTIKVRWEQLEGDGGMTVNVTVPDNTRCRLCLPDGSEEWLEAGVHIRSEK